MIFIAAAIPNPPAQEIPGLGPFISMILGWLKYAAMAGGVVGLLICAIMIISGRRNRNAMATDGLTGSVWVMGGLALASAASVLVGAINI